MGTEPTFWGWVGFWVQLALAFYALCIFIGDRVPGLTGLGRFARRATWWVVDRFGNWLIRWFYWPIFRAIWRTLMLLWELPGTLWRGQRPDLAMASAAPVTRIRIPLPASYVAAFAPAAPPERNESPVAATAAEARNVIAMPQTERNPALPSNVVTRAQAELIARLIKAESLHIPDGKGGYRRIGQTDLIRLATGIAPNGRPDSDYGRLKAELDPLIKPTVTIAAGRREERVIDK